MGTWTITWKHVALTSGSNDDTGGLLDPWKDLDYAVSQLISYGSGGVGYGIKIIESGTITSIVSLDGLIGTQQKRIPIVGAAADGTLDGTSPEIDFNGMNYGFQLGGYDASGYYILGNLLFSNYVISLFKNGGLYVNGPIAYNITCENGAGWADHIFTFARSVYEDVTFYNCNTYGSYVLFSDYSCALFNRIRFIGCTGVYGFQTNAGSHGNEIIMHDCAITYPLYGAIKLKNSVLDGNNCTSLIYQNATSYTFSASYLLNTLITNNTCSDAQLKILSELTIADNAYYNNAGDKIDLGGTGNILDSGTDIDDIGFDPYMDRANDDFRTIAAFEKRRFSRSVGRFNYALRQYDGDLT